MLQTVFEQKAHDLVGFFLAVFCCQFHLIDGLHIRQRTHKSDELRIAPYGYSLCELIGGFAQIPEFHHARNEAVIVGCSA